MKIVSTSIQYSLFKISQSSPQVLEPFISILSQEVQPLGIALKAPLSASGLLSSVFIVSYGGAK